MEAQKNIRKRNVREIEELTQLQRGFLLCAQSGHQHLVTERIIYLS
jgi:hypothetical protein